MRLFWSFDALFCHVLGFIGFGRSRSASGGSPGPGSQPQSLALPANIQDGSPYSTKAPTMPSITHLSPTTTKPFVGCELNYGERRSGVALHVLQKGKIKISLPSG